MAVKRKRVVGIRKQKVDTGCYTNSSKLILYWMKENVEKRWSMDFVFKRYEAFIERNDFYPKLNDYTYIGRLLFEYYGSGSNKYDFDYLNNRYRKFEKRLRDETNDIAKPLVW